MEKGCRWLRQYSPYLEGDEKPCCQAGVIGVYWYLFSNHGTALAKMWLLAN